MALKVQTYGVGTLGASGVEMVCAPTFGVDFGIELLALSRQRREPREPQHDPRIASWGIAKVHTPVQGWMGHGEHAFKMCPGTPKFVHRARVELGKVETHLKLQLGRLQSLEHG